MTARQRRKIFPHLEEDSKTGTSDANGTTDDANDASNNNGNDSNSKNKNEGSYDNDKSNKSKGRSNNSGQSSTDESNTSNNNNNNNNASSATMKHLLPLPLVLTVLVCSGLFWIASFRDAFATGKPMLDTLSVLWGQEDADANLLVSVIPSVYCLQHSTFILFYYFTLLSNTVFQILHCIDSCGLCLCFDCCNYCIICSLTPSFRIQTNNQKLQYQHQ